MEIYRLNGRKKSVTCCFFLSYLFHLNCLSFEHDCCQRCVQDEISHMPPWEKELKNTKETRIVVWLCCLVNKKNHFVKILWSLSRVSDSRRLVMASNQFHSSSFQCLSLFFVQWLICNLLLLSDEYKRNRTCLLHTLSYSVLLLPSPPLTHQHCYQRCFQSAAVASKPFSKVCQKLCSPLFSSQSKSRTIFGKKKMLPLPLARAMMFAPTTHVIYTNNIHIATNRTDSLVRSKINWYKWWVRVNKIWFDLMLPLLFFLGTKFLLPTANQTRQKFKTKNLYFSFRMTSLWFGSHSYCKT